MPNFKPISFEMDELGGGAGLCYPKDSIVNRTEVLITSLCICFLSYLNLRYTKSRVSLSTVFNSDVPIASWFSVTKTKYFFLFTAFCSSLKLT